MSSELKVFSMSIGKDEKGRKTYTDTEIFSCYANDEVGEDLLSHQFDCWHVESDCGAIFEIDGLELQDVFSNHEVTEDLATEIEEDDFYKVELSF